MDGRTSGVGPLFGPKLPSQPYGHSASSQLSKLHKFAHLRKRNGDARNVWHQVAADRLDWAIQILSQVIVMAKLQATPVRATQGG